MPPVSGWLWSGWKLNIVNVNGNCAPDKTSGAKLGTALSVPSAGTMFDALIDADGVLYESVPGTGSGGQILASRQGEPTALTDINGDFAFHNVPFVAALPLAPAVITAPQTTTANGGISTTTAQGQYPNQIVTEDTQSFVLNFSTRSGNQFIVVSRLLEARRKTI
jgi:hypothetical protein